MSRAQRSPWIWAVVAAAWMVMTATPASADITIVQAAGANYDLSDPLTGLPAGDVGTVTLNPAMVTHLAAPAAGSNFLATFIADVAQYPGWTAVTGAALGGVLTVNQYTAHDYGTARGGADMKATYARAAADPASLRWIQMFTDNTGPMGALVRHIDPFPNDDGMEKEPFYYTQAQENAQFVDFPSDAVGPAPFTRTVRFETYLASFDNATKVATIHDGFAWGYDIVVVKGVVPEPASLAMMVVGGGLCAAARSRARGKARRAAA